MIDRRTALAGVVAMFGTALYAPIARAAGVAATPGAATGIPVISEGPPSVAVFTAPQRALMTALSLAEPQAVAAVAREDFAGAMAALASATSGGSPCARARWAPIVP